jgi:hypothetical protein
MDLKKIIVFLFFGIVFSYGCGNLSYEPSNAIFGEDIVLNFSKVLEFCNIKSVEVKPSIDSETSIIFTNYTFVKIDSSDLNKFGFSNTFYVIVHCDNTPLYFECTLPKVDLKIINARRYENFAIVEFEFLVNDSYPEITDFSIFLSCSEKKIEKIYKDTTLKIEFIPLRDFCNLTIFYYPLNRSFSKTFYLEKYDPISYNIYYQDTVEENSNHTIKFEVFFEKEKVNNANIKVFYKDKTFYSYPCHDYFCVDIIAPKESSEINFEIEYNGIKKQGSFYLRVLKKGFISFFDLDGNSISAEIFIGNRKFRIDGNGTVLFERGKNNITIKILNAEISMINCYVDDISNSFRFIPIKTNDNLKILRAYRFENSLNCEDIVANLYYNEREVTSEDRILALECLNFDLKNLKCKEWKEIKSNIDKIGNKVEIEPKNEVFGIFEKKDLRIQYSISKKELFYNENFVIRGILIDEDGNLVDGKIIVDFLGKKEINTNNGQFEVSLRTPNFTSEINLTILTAVDFYNNVKVIEKIRVFPKIELIVLTKSLNESYRILEILNSGQIRLKNISVECIKCDFEKNTIDEIYVGEIKKLEVKNFTRDSNPTIIKIVLKVNEKVFEYEIPVFFESKKEENVLPTSYFVLTFNKLYLIPLAIFLIILIFISARKKKTNKLLFRSLR